MRASAYLLGFLGIGLIATATSLGAEDKAEAKGDKVEYDRHDGHFVKNNFEPKNNEAFLAIGDQKAFDAAFGVAAVGGKKFNWVPKDAFDKKLVVAVFKRGNAVTEFKVDKVTADGDTLYVQYGAEAKGSGGTATFASPLILTVDKGKIKNVVFIENGKKVGTAEVGKGS
jgi:hypothetical protein